MRMERRKNGSNLGRTAELLLVLVTLIRFLRGDARGAEDGDAGEGVVAPGVADGDLEAYRRRLHRDRGGGVVAWLGAPTARP